MALRSGRASISRSSCNSSRVGPSWHARCSALRNMRTFFHRLYREVLDTNITDLGAMMAFYAILALFPMLIVVVTIALLVLPADVLDQGVAIATEAMPPTGREL